MPEGERETIPQSIAEIRIYKAHVPGRDPGNYPRRSPWYNDSSYRAQVSLPRSSAGTVSRWP
jgi:hypothetical protein